MERRVLRGVSVSHLHRLRRSRSGGFTLVELAIVVAIVGVLAVIALVGYRRYMLNAKVAEARQMIGAIRLAQEAYKSEKGTYANVPTWCPAAAGSGDKLVGWNPACGTPPWQTLAVHVDGPVRFQYATVAGEGNPPANNVLLDVVDYQGGKVGPYYVIGARCDLDGDPTVNTEVVGTSYDNIIRTKNDGS